jgi:hypothetical protein
MEIYSYFHAQKWIREYDEEKAVIDTSIRYLDHYQVMRGATA